MDPNLFHLDWEKTFETLTMVVVLAFMIERALSVVFENRLFIKLFEDKGIKEVVTIVFCTILCYGWKFDAVSIILSRDKISFWGSFITGAVIAGGSKGSLKLFRDVLGFMSTAEKERQSKIKAAVLPTQSSK